MGADFMDSDNIRMIQLGHYIGLAPEVLLDVRILDLLGLNDLEGNLLVEDVMVGQLNFAERSLSNPQRKKLIVSN